MIEDNIETIFRFIGFLPTYWNLFNSTTLLYGYFIERLIEGTIIKNRKIFLLISVNFKFEFNFSLIKSDYMYCEI